MWQIKPHKRGLGKPAAIQAPVRTSHFTVIERPRRYQGVDRALTSAFPVGEEVIPADMLALLDKLDE